MREITSRPFGVTRTGESVTEFTLTNVGGAHVAVLDYGCTIRTICVPDRRQALRDVALGYQTLQEYENCSGFLGATAGRCANRIAGGCFTLGGEMYQLYKNNGENSLHGGKRGFDKYVWSHTLQGESVVFSRTSPEGEENYPGTLETQITFHFADDGTLSITYMARSDRDTLVNLTNHSYFNLEGDGSGTVEKQLLRVNATHYTPVDAELIPTGALLPVRGTPLDFTVAKAIGRDLRELGGYDHNFALDGTGLREAAVLEAPESGICMSVYTDLPGVQVYTGGGLGSTQKSKTGLPYAPYQGVCLETQFYPDAIHHPTFPSPILAAGKPFHSVTQFRFTVAE